MSTLVVVFLALAGAAFLALRWFEGLPNKKKKKWFTKSVNRYFVLLENLGLLRRTVAYDRDYHRQYPGLDRLEANYADVREECLALLGIKDQLTDMTALGAGYTNGGIHTAQWKAFMFKSGNRFIEENCVQAPKTTALLRGIPGMETAFFSILDPRQYITPHWGYYKGYMRYHLGVIIPDNNAEQKCWLRVNDNRAQNALKDKDQIAFGEKYHWHDGEGIVFDDNYLHDASNESDQVRVVLWLDLRRKMPFYASLFNRFVLWLAGRDKSVEKIRKKATVNA